MRPSEIERWALDMVDRVLDGYPNEDALVELKATWTEPHKAARQLAGHANAARGENILWLIGVDQQARAVVNVPHVDLAQWWPRVASHFDGVAPRPVDINVPVAGKTIVAILFETVRAPFVVTNPTGIGSITHEVPWREGTSVRSARREDLLRILVPAQRRPEVRLRTATVSVHLVAGQDDIVATGSRPLRREEFPYLHCRVSCELYMVPLVEGRIVIPFHDCELELDLANGIQRTPAGLLRLKVPVEPFALNLKGLQPRPSPTVAATPHEVILDGPATVDLIAEAVTDSSALGDVEEIGVYASLLPTNADAPIDLSVRLTTRSPLAREFRRFEYP